MTLPEYLKVLEKLGSLKKVSAQVDPDLEIAEIVNRLYQAPGSPQVPVILFENVKGSKFPLAINLLGTDENVCLALGEPPEAIGTKIVQSILDFKVNAPQGKLLSWLWKERAFLKRALAAKPKRVSSAPFKEVIKKGADVNLDEFPVMKSWPLDGGKFITSGLVFTKSPVTGERNVGVYRLQIFNRNEVGLHWQIQKGGDFHYQEAAKLNQPLEVAVVIGADPLLWLSSIFPLPEGMDEIAFTGLLSGKPVEMVPCETLDMEVPATAEIVLEGIARPGRKMPEGPFGDHFGHYSHASQFPVMEVQAVSHKKNAVYQSTIVGKPPQEDRAMGEAVTKIFLPFIKLIKPELYDLWAYFEAGFHNLLVASVRQRYDKEGLKTAFGLLGEGQLSLSKVVVLVDPEVNVKDFKAVLRAIQEHFNPAEDFILLPGTSQDTLDFTGAKMNRGSKIILDATAGRSPKNELKNDLGQAAIEAALRGLDERIDGWLDMNQTLLAVRVKSGRESKGCKDLLAKILAKSELQGYKMIALVSEDVPLDHKILLLWGIFTRFDCERDLQFGKAEFKASRPVYSGPMGIDATWKKGYPLPVEMDPKVVEKVTARWKKYAL